MSSLLQQQDAISLQLLDAGRRAEARARVQGASATADAEAAAKVDELLDTLERRHGGIPRDRLDRLRSLAGTMGITASQIDARLSERTIIDEAATAVEPIPAGTRRQVAALLAELARLDPEAGTHRTLYGFLGVPVGAATDAVEARRDALDARNRQRRHDRLRTVVDELLALAETLLVTGDPARYLAGIEEGVREELRPAIETAVLLEDKVGVAETERLTREAVSAGLDPAVARDLVIEVARSLSAPIDVGTVPDYVVCAACNAAGTPPAGTTTAECARCGAELFRTCPQCGRTAARSDVRCPACRFDLRQHDEAVRARDEEVAAALEAAAAGPADAREATLLAVLDRHPDAPAVAEALAAVGVRPATAVVATTDGPAVAVRWTASPSPGPIEYRVARTVDRTGGATTPLGRVRATDVEDAGAPAGEPVRYSVVASRLGTTADAATSEPVVHTPEVAGLEAIEHDGAVELRWAPVRVGDVWVERRDAATADDAPRLLRAGPTGVLDTSVRSGTTYTYRVGVEYPGPGGAAPIRTSGREVEALAFALPDAPPAPDVAPSGRSITVSVPRPEAGVEAVLLRAASAPSVAAGATVEPAALREVGGPLAGRDGTGYDAADGGPRWYVAAHVVGDHAVVGAAVAHPGVAEVERVRIEVDADGPVVRWDWPAACTEAQVHWSTGPDPVVPGGPGVTAHKVTNVAYDVAGGFRPPGATGAPLRVLVLAAGRIDGALVAVPGWSNAATAAL